MKKELASSCAAAALILSNAALVSGFSAPHLLSSRIHSTQQSTRLYVSNTNSNSNTKWQVPFLPDSNEEAAAII